MGETQHEQKGVIGQQTDNAPRLEENLLHMLTSNAPVGVYLLDKNASCQYVNQTWCELTGMAPEEALGNGWLRAMHPDDRERASEQWKQLNLTQWGWQQEYRLQAPNGKITWIAGYITKLRDERGSVIGYFGINVDVSSTKNIEMALRASEERYRTTIDAMSDGIHVVDKNLVITLNNSTIARWAQEMGLSGILVGKTPFKVFPFLPEQVEDEYRDVFQTGKMLVTEEKSRFAHKLMHTETRKVPIVENGRVAHVATVIRDISKRAEAEQALRESEEKYRLLFENMAQGVFYQQADGKLIDVNSSALEMLGVTRDQFLGRTSYHPAWKVVLPDGTFLPPEQHPSMVALSTGKRIDDFELGVYHPQTNDYAWLVVNVIPQFREGEEKPYQVFVTLHDNTERKKNNEKLQRQAQEMKALQETVLDIIAPHDLSTLLPIIVERAIRLLGAAEGGIYLNDPVKEEVRCVVSHNTKRDYTGTVLKYGEGAAGIVAQTGEALIIDDYRTWPGRANVFENEQPFTSILSVPLLWQDQVIGVLHILNDGEGKTFSKADQDLLSMFAAYASIAVGKAEAFEQAQKEISERKQAENALRESELKLKEAEEVAHFGHYEIDIQSGEAKWSSETFRIFGMDPDTATEPTIQEYINYLHPDDVDNVFSHFDQAINEKKAFDLDYRIITLNKQTRYIHSVGHLVSDTTGASSTMFGVFHDITERKQAEAALVHSEELYRNILTSISDAVYITDEHGFFTFICANTDVIFGHTFKEVEKMGDIRKLLGKQIVAYEDLVKQGEITNIEHEIVDKSGFRHNLLINVKKVDIENGKMLFTCHDVTELKQAEIALQESQKNLQAILDATAQSALLIETDGRIVICNESFSNQFRKEKNEMFGINAFELFEEKVADNRWDYVNQVVASGEAVRFVDERNGKVINSSIYPVFDESGQVVRLAIYGQDITEQKQAELELEKTTYFLEESQRIGQFGSWDWKFSNNEAWWSDTLFDIYGRDQALGVPPLDNDQWLETIYPEDRDALQEAIQTAIQQRSDYEAEYRIIRENDGEIRTIFARGKITPDSDGNPERLIGTALDITERKRIETNLEVALEEANLRQKETMALLEAAQAIPLCETFEKSARKIFDICKDLLGAKSGYVALLSEDGAENEVLFLDAGGLPCDVDPELPMPIRGLREVAYRTNEVAYENEFTGSPWIEYMPQGHVELENVLFAPLNIHNKTVGLIGFANKPGGFTERDAKLAKTFGDLAAVGFKFARNQDELRESEKRYRLLAENSTDVIALYDGEYKPLYISPSSAKLSGYSLEDFTNASIFDFVHPDDRTEFLEKIKLDVEQKKTNSRNEFRYRRKDGKYVWVETISNRLYDEAGNLTETLSNIREITERKRAEQQLKDAIEQLHLAINTGKLGMWTLDIESNHLDWNDQQLEIYGLTRQEFEEDLDSWRKQVHPEDKEYADSRLATVFEGKPVFDVGFRIIRPDGEIRYIDASATPIYNDAGEIVKLIGINRDITKQKQAELTLKENQNYIQRVADTIPNQLYIFDMPKKHNVYINQKSEDFFGITLEELQSKGQAFLLDILHPADLAKMDEFNVQWDSAEDGQVFNKEYRIKNANGKYRWIKSYESILTRGPDGKPIQIVGMAVDITEQKIAHQEKEQLLEAVTKQREELRILNARLAESDETERRRIAKGLHDQIGQNLSALSINMNIIKSQIPAGSKELSTRINNSLQLVDETTDEIRKVMEDLHPTVLDDYGLFPALEWLSDRISRSTNLLIDVKSTNLKETRLNHSVEVNLFRITQEALNNVIRHAKAERVRIHLKQLKKVLRLSIGDDGTGFDVTAQQELVDRGWGLRIMRERAESIGGRFRVESAADAGTGTKVIVELSE